MINITKKGFWEEVHKKAVKFRNKKRQQYLNNELSLIENGFVERWDCDPRMFNVLISEEPLSINH